MLYSGIKSNDCGDQKDDQVARCGIVRNFSNVNAFDVMMKLKPVNPDFHAYLQASTVIDWQHPAILDLARRLAGRETCNASVTKYCFEWVRDHIKHSLDFKLNPVTCTASEVLQHKTGYCYAKSHLLAALLRANGIPAGLCYQRLSVESNGAPYCLHGLNAVYLPDYGWYRIDPRGNKQDVDAQFDPPREQLAFKVTDKLEKDFAEIWPEPLPAVLETLKNSNTYRGVDLNLPDYIQEN